MGTSFRKEDGLNLTESTGLVTESLTELGTERRRSMESGSDILSGKKSSSSPPLLGWPIKAAIPKSVVSGSQKPVLNDDSELKKHNLNISGNFGNFKFLGF